MTTQAEALVELLEQLASLPPLGGWVTSAACRGETDLFTAYQASRSAAAKVTRICDACPVRATCEEYAGLYEVDGVWAGTWHNSTTGTSTPAAPAARPPGRAVECGTYGGYRRHRRQREPACDACRAANAAQAKQYSG